jgi:transcriptional regulator with PAS, ATPase and Fis domain
MIKEKSFREDLYYRLNVVPLFIPPLRERKDEIIPLINHFMEKFNTQYEMEKTIEPHALECLTQYDWPGNTRELENIIERLIVTVGNNIITPADLPESLRNRQLQCSGLTHHMTIDSYHSMLNAFEHDLLEHVMSLSDSTKEMAEILKIDKSSVTRKLKKHNIPIFFPAKRGRNALMHY